MLDPKFIRENVDEVQANIRHRNVDASAELVARLYDERNDAIKELESLRARRNDNAKQMKQQLDADVRAALVEEGKRLKAQIPEFEQKVKDIEANLNEEAGRIPNMSHPGAPIGSTDADNAELKRVGTPFEFRFEPRDHVTIAEALDLIDFETATKVSGTKFYYLKNEAVFLEFALSRYAMDVLVKHGFTPTITPDIAREEVARGIGFNPRGAESNIYTLEGEGTCLVGTAEITLGGYHADSILDADSLPIRMAGFSHCFRREAGAAGQFSKGLYRVHQFSKVEMFVYCRPEESERIHDELLAIEEEIFQGLEVPYRVVDTCTGDLGGPAYRKYDIEAWMPGRGEKGDWGEVTSASNCTDYQARRLGVRFRQDKHRRLVHMLNGTAIAVSRAIIAILENHQQEDGSIRIPERLKPYFGSDSIGPRTAAG
ncbi:MAG: serine--tRNA ligase [Spirochaetes bacterium]|jgi:seryl-tRNA synthetase|nr:serine--tRNA ligase [Spirochaetota bacterium]